MLQLQQAREALDRLGVQTLVVTFEGREAASAYLEDWGSRLGSFPALVLPATADFFLNNWEFCSHKAKSQLNYSPRALQEGLESTYRWMKETNLV